MLFSVVIPTYNQLALLTRALESVWQQSFTDYEVIVVDDGSTDGTADYLANLGERLGLIRQTNQGPGAARNNGFVHARGDYVAFLDSDDMWLPWTLATAAELIRKHDRPAVINARTFEFQEESEIANVEQKPVDEEVFSDYVSSCGHPLLVGSGMAIIRRDLLVATGGFIKDRVNAEDHDLLLRLGVSARFVQIHAPVTLAYRRHPSSATGDVHRTACGVLRLVRQEKNDIYPGGAARAQQRREIIARHARAAAVASVTTSAFRDAWSLYEETFWWQMRLRRWRFLFALPALAARAMWRRPIRTPGDSTAALADTPRTLKQ